MLQLVYKYTTTRAIYAPKSLFSSQTHNTDIYGTSPSNKQPNPLLCVYIYTICVLYFALTRGSWHLASTQNESARPVEFTSGRAASYSVQLRRDLRISRAIPAHKVHASHAAQAAAAAHETS